MNKIPIVFSFDDKMLLPAGVCISSLLSHASADTYYDIFILHDEKSTFPRSGFLEQLSSQFANYKLTYKNTANLFAGAYETRGITIATYYRLLIPELVIEYGKVMYHDVDLIFRSDLSAIFHQTDLRDCYVAGVRSPGGFDEEVKTYRENLGLDSSQYILAGDIILNLDLMRQDGLVDRFKTQVAANSYRYQDMDVLNIVCKGKIKFLPASFCGTVELFRFAAYRKQQSFYSITELEAMQKDGIVHYNGTKPWNAYCPNFDIWWMYYRQSVFYDAKYYFDFFDGKRNEYDSLPLWKRVKILLRFFKPNKK
ncbi:glycosyltransferase family 8 protein [Sphingobacterium ginsenosidimutans]